MKYITYNKKCLLPSDSEYDELNTTQGGDEESLT
jgi:hypothetical protein